MVFSFPFRLVCLAFALLQTTAIYAAQDASIPLIHQPPVIDGVMSESEWANAARFSIATQSEPVSGVPGTETTEAYIMYDSQNLYIAFRALDSNPSGIRAPVSRRDNVSQDDFVAFWLDTYNDRRRAFAFRISPLGIQEDGIFSDGDRSLSWDGIFESKGTVDPLGYTVEVKIPFETLRYRTNSTGTWGLHLFRYIARKNETVSWMPISRDNANIFSQMGAVSGLTAIESNRKFEIIPTLVGSITSAREVDPSHPSGISRNSVNRLEPGVTAIYQLTSNLTLSATVNPDFSQIEADAPQVTVNQRFPLFFDEKRPFFLEGAEIFRPFSAAPRLIDTRQIVDPEWGIKLTGRLGKNGIGLLVASDKAQGLRLPRSDEDYGKQANFAIARYTRDIFKESTVGAAFTNYSFGDYSNSVMTLDGRVRFDERQSFAYQVSYSATTDRNAKKTGVGAYFAYNYNDRKWDLVVSDSHFTKDFVARTGFIRRTGYDRLYLSTGRTFRPKEKSWWVSVRPFVVALAFWDENKDLDESFLDPGVDITLAKGISIYTYISTRRDTFQRVGLRSNSFNLRWSIDSFKRFKASGSVEKGTDANFDPDRIEVGSLTTNRLTLTFLPVSKLRSSISWNSTSLSSRPNGEGLFSQDIFSKRTTYQFNRFNSLRSIIDYDTLSRRTGISFVYAYTPQPNTALFVGYGDQLYNGIDPLNFTRRPGLLSQGRSLFAKASYSIRF